MNEVALRTLTGVLMILTALAAEWFGGTAFAILVALAATGIYFEWMRMVRGWGIGWKVAGFFFALLPAVALLWVRERGGDPQGSKGFELVLWTFIVTWSADIGAFFAGRSFGGPKLAPSISPNKTISGLIGGLVAATLIGGIWANYAGLDRAWLLLAPVFAAFAAMGDLFESWMKRRAGVKDSGRLIPGHGGVFDRLDGLMPVAVLTALAVLAGLS
ncbi:phosphatidate cytidylyltransferase [Sphingomonas astaxanthinifaciens]|uniref:Phosphatidate cytidylyltransferase n=1 Tax=Sphingomonas astaxanthinifaciens DSM 22298 TaxID=1123267 RepID=A0ABQ5ZCR5_9SPHN|nr:phosphatidate cytidylyltransferase [Sphingomonas astaxanthinifaciens]GLR48594.1 phosphatidate cytidylyltransferase [Sphingomonas astaxanthinifaciens DSM 22298]